MTDYEYAIEYDGTLIYDSSWRCVADVLKSYHGGDYLTPDMQVTGVLVRAPRGTANWERV